MGNQTRTEEAGSAKRKRLRVSLLLKLAATHEASANVARDLAECEVSEIDGEWVDQNTSPLGHDRHLRFVREGKLRSFKDGKSVFVRRAEISSYIASLPPALRALPPAPESSPRDLVGDVLAELGARPKGPKT